MSRKIGENQQIEVNGPIGCTGLAIDAFNVLTVPFIKLLIEKLAVRLMFRYDDVKLERILFEWLAGKLLVYHNYDEEEIHLIRKQVYDPQQFGSVKLIGKQMYENRKINGTTMELFYSEGAGGYYLVDNHCPVYDVPERTKNLDIYRINHRPNIIAEFVPVGLDYGWCTYCAYPQWFFEVDRVYNMNKLPQIIEESVF